jgi:hypothetical protein
MPLPTSVDMDIRAPWGPPGNINQGSRYNTRNISVFRSSPDKNEI